MGVEGSYDQMAGRREEISGRVGVVFGGRGDARTGRAWGWE